MTKLKIPDFKSLKEAADYWATHSFADYIEDTEPVEIGGKDLYRIRKLFEPGNY